MNAVRSVVTGLTLAVVTLASLAHPAAADSNTGGNQEGADYPVEIQREECRYIFTRDGRKTISYRRVYRVLNTEGLRWNAVSATWSSWFQKRPVIEATVTAPDGTVTRLDPATLGEVAENQDDQNVYTDRRALRGPLPAIQIGSVVDETITTEDTLAYFPRGGNYYYRFSGTIPVREMQLTIVMPRGMPFHHRVHNSSIGPERTEEGDAVTYRFSAKGIRAQGSYPIYSPSDREHWMAIEFSTAESWAAVARAYGELVQPQLVTDESTRPLVARVREGGRTGRALIDRALMVVHETARYTGVEFGAASIVPRRPAEVLTRRYGDCKDKAALLVVLLREAGIAAHLALLRAGSGPDICTATPGIDLFNHAVVYVPAPYDLWIDATAPWVPAGEVPVGDQGRWALVIANGTRDLVKVPRSRPEQNRVSITRDVYLPLMGSGRMVETATFTGRPADGIRSFFADNNRSQLEKRILEYVKKNFEGDAVERIEHADPRAFSTPMHYRIVVPRAAIFGTALENAWVNIEEAKILNELPDEVLDFQHYENGAEKEQSPWHGRTVPVRLPLPLTYEVRYRIHLPPGFEATELPATEVQTAGGVTISRTYRQDGDLVTADIRLAVDGASHAPGDFARLRQQLQRLQSNRFRNVTIVSTGTRLFEKGDVAKGITLLQGIVKRYPREPGALLRMGDLLLTAGFRDAATKLIEKAIALDGSLEDAHMLMGWACHHDPYGRRFKGSIEIDRARAAYEKVLALNPGNTNALKSLAILAEYDPLGNRYSPEVAPARAVALYREYRQKARRNDLDFNYALALFNAGDYDAIVDMPDWDVANNHAVALHLTAVALRQGLPAFWLRLDGITTDVARRRTIVSNAAEHCMNIRRYDLAAQLLSRLSSFAQDAVRTQSQAAYLGRVKPWESVPVPAGKPEEALHRFFRAFFLDGDIQAAADCFVAAPDGVMTREKIVEHFTRVRREYVRGMSENLRSHRAMFDMFMSNMVCDATGDERGGWRIMFRSETWDRNYEGAYYAVPTPAGFRLLFTDAGTFAVTMGLRARELHAAGRYAEAARVLGWVLDQAGAVPADPFEGSPFLHVYRQGTADPAMIGLAAAMLLVERPGEVEVLERLRERVTDPAVRLQVDRTLYAVYIDLQQFERAHAILKRLMAEAGNRTPLVSAYVGVLLRMNRGAEGCELARALAAKHPRDPELVYILASAESESGDHARALRVLEDAYGRGVGNARSYNLHAWIGLFTGVDTARLAEISLKSNQQSDYLVRAFLHTLATVYAEAGRVAEAQQVVARMLENAGESTVTDSDYYVLGRNAETMGLSDTAREYYRKVNLDPNEARGLSVWELARRRLRVLGDGAEKRQEERTPAPQQPVR